jgi:hypothetical protein
MTETRRAFGERFKIVDVATYFRFWVIRSKEKKKGERKSLFKSSCRPNAGLSCLVAAVIYDGRVSCMCEESRDRSIKCDES